jgi:hypothetical protein
MARPTQQEIEEWEARMSEPEEPDPDDFEVVLFDNEGNPVGTMPYAKAKAYFKKRGIDFDDELPNAGTNASGGNAAVSQGGNSGNSAPGAPVPPRTRATSRYFGKQSGGSASTAVDPGNLPPGSQPI